MFGQCRIYLVYYYISGIFSLSEYNTYEVVDQENRHCPVCNYLSLISLATYPHVYMRDYNGARGFFTQTPDTHPA